MTAPFGFSAGDIAMAIKMIAKIVQGLKDCGGSATEYQETIGYLKSLLLSLQHLETLYSKTKDDNIAKAVEALATATQKPILEFLGDINGYDATLGRDSLSKSVRGGIHKINWALRVTKKIPKLKANISADLEAIHLLLGSQSLYCLVTNDEIDDES